jgi:hypothetical protein
MHKELFLLGCQQSLNQVNDKLTRVFLKRINIAKYKTASYVLCTSRCQKSRRKITKRIYVIISRSDSDSETIPKSAVGNNTR